MRVRAAQAMLILAAVALAGCLGAGDATEPDATPTTTPEPDEPGGPGDGPVVPAGAAETTLYFTADGGLGEEPPSEGRLPLGSSPTGLFVGDFDVPTFIGDAVDAPMWFHSGTVTVTVWVESAVPLPSTQLFDVAAWGGTTRSMPLFAFETFPGGFLEPGVPVAMEIHLDFGDYVDLYVPAGEALSFYLASLNDAGAGQLVVLVGGEHASNVQLTLGPAEDHLQGLAAAEEQVFEGVLRNMSMTDCAVLEGVTHEFHDAEVPAGTTYLEFALELTGGLMPADLDFDLFDGGRHVGGGHKPFPDEGMLFAGPTAEALAGKTVQLRVSTCTGTDAEYRATVWYAAPAAP